MKKLIAAALMLVCLTGCAALETASDVIGILIPDEPDPVCDQDSVGAAARGNQCLKYSDGTYRWSRQ